MTDYKTQHCEEVMRSVIGYIPIEAREDMSMNTLRGLYKALIIMYDVGYDLGKEDNKCP